MITGPLRKIIFLVTILLCSISMTLPVSANLSFKDSEMTVSRETLVDFGYTTTIAHGASPSMVATSARGQYKHSHPGSSVILSSGTLCSGGSRYHHYDATAHTIYFAGGDLFQGQPVSGVNNNTSYGVYLENGVDRCWNLGQAVVYSKSTASQTVRTIVWSTTPLETNYYYSPHCTDCGISWSWTNGGHATCTYYVGSYYTRNATYTCKTVTPYKTLSSIILSNCTTQRRTITTQVPMTIVGGQYSGSPAIDAAHDIIVKKATITDSSSSQTSKFILDEDSEQTIATNGSTTITTVKLSNPPVIIDWADFPG